MASDRVAAAIAAVEEPSAPSRATVKVTLGTGRDVILNTPADLVAGELFALIGYLAGPQFPARLAEARAAHQSPLLVPDRKLVRV